MVTKLLDEEFEHFQEYLNKGIDQLMEIWTSIGLSENDLILRKNVMMGHLKNLLDEMVQEEERTRMTLYNNIKNNQQEVLKLCTELKLPAHEPDQDLTIIQMERDLRLKLEYLQKEKAKKLERLKNLSKIDQDLCNMLCEIPFYLPSNIVPNEEQLDELDRHIRSLEDKRDQREQTFKQMKEEIKSMLLQLDIPLVNQFEQEVVMDSDDSFVLSQENMKLLAAFHERLDKRLKENIEMRDKQISEMHYLWDQLGISIDQRTTFTNEHTGVKQKTILAMNEEINRCKLLKIQNASTIIVTLRKQLEKLWDKCYIPKDQRKLFAAFYSNEWNEELLVKHEEEIRKLKSYYEEHKCLFQKVQHRDMVWEQYLDFERKTNNSNRFYDKAWSFLQEEKERKKVLKELPRLDSEVNEEIGLWQEKTGRTFLINGHLYNDYVKLQMEEHKAHKENEKQYRQQVKQRKIEEERLYGSKPSTTPVKKPLIPSTVCKSASKSSAKKALQMTPKHMNEVKQPIIDLKVVPSSDSFLLSQTMVGSSEVHKYEPDATLAPIDQYTEFELRLNENIRSQTRSSIANNLSDDGGGDDSYDNDK